MNKGFHRTPSSGFRVFNASLLSFLLIMMPFVQVAAAARRVSGVRGQVSEKNSSPTVNQGANSAADLFVNPPVALGITATKTDAYTAHPGPAAPGDTITYTVDVANPNPPGNDATGVTLTDIIDANTTRFGADFDLKVSPLAINDAYSAIKNTPLVVNAASGVLANDSGVPAPTANAIAAGPTTAGGTITLNADGSFTYTAPNATFTGPDTFTYTNTNGNTPPNPGVDNQATVTINVDAAPEVSSTTPADNAIDQAGNTDITITFSEAVNVTGNWFQIVCTSSGIRNVADTAVTGGPVTFTINPNTDFTQAETCTVTVDDAAVTDQDTNDPPDTMAADYVFDFTMDAAPSVQSITPTNGATGVPTSADIVITFSEAVDVTGSSFVIQCPPGAGNEQAFGVTGTGTNTITLNPTANLPNGTNCAVQIIGTQVADSDTNDPPNNMTSSPVFSFTTDAAPTVSSTTPTQAATIVATNTNITLNFSESVDIAAGGITLNCGAGNLAFTPALPQNGVTSIVIDPAANLPPNTLCTVTGVSTLITDVDTADPPNQLDGDANGSEGPNFTLTFTTDSAPRVTSTTPVQGATGVGASTNITLNFSESVDIAAGGITLNCGAGNLSFTPALPQNGVSSIVIDPDADLPFGTLCTVTGVAANITDVDTGDPPNQLDGNNDGTEGDNFTLTFTIDVAPTVTTTLPADLATDVAQSSTVTINFSENVNVAAGGVTINCGSAVAFTPALPQLNTNSLVLTPTGGLPAGSNCTVTVVAANVTDTDSGDPPDNMVADHVFTFKVKPDAVNDNVQTATGQTVIGNVSFNTANIPYSVTTNDVSANAFTVSAFDGTSANGGTVVMTTSGAGMGQFTYNPSRGFEGADTFNYTISRTDGGGSDTATVTINVSGMIWFIQNAAVACSPQCGRLSNPYPTLAAFNTDNLLGGLNPDNNDNIFIYEHAVDYTGAVIMRSGQKLIGQDATATLESIAGVTVFSGSTALPAMNSGNGVFTNIVSTVTMHNSSTVRGLRINTTGSDKGLVAVTKTGLVVNEVATISSVNGTAVDFSATSTGTFTFTNISATGSGAGLSFASTTSGSTVNINNITTTTGAAMTTSSTGTTDFTVNDVTSTTGTAVDVNTATGDFIFHKITKNGGSTGIDVDSATGSFTVNGDSTTAGTGGTIQNTTSHGAKFIGSNNITLKNMNLTSNAQTQSSSNVNCGNNLVAGNTTLCTANLYLSSVTTISLTNLSITGSTQEGIAGTSVSGLTLANSTIENNGGEDYENGFLFKNLTGTVSITNSNIRNNFSRQGHIFNDGSSALTLNVTGTLFGRTVAPGVSSQQGLLMELQGTSSTSVDVGTSSFNNNGNGNGLQINAASSATVGTVGTHSSVHNSTSMTNNAAHVFVNTSGSAVMYFDTMNNAVMTAAVLQSIDYFANGGSLTGIIQGNTIGTDGVAASGCATALGGCDGMTIDKALTGNLSLRIESNTIQQINTNGIALGGANSGGSINASIINNTIRQPSNSAAANSQGNAMYLNMGTVNPSAFTACLNVTGNTISDTAAKTWDINGSFAMIYVRARNTATVRIPGAAAGSAAAADTFITANNTFTRVFVPNVEPVLTEAVGGGTYANGAACTVPLLLGDGGVDAISFLSALTDLATNASGDRHNLGRVSSLNQAQLDAIVSAATQRWMATGLTQQQIAAMRELRFELGDLPNTFLGEASGNRIVVDRDAQGKGWFIDTTPADDLEFGDPSSATRRYTNPFTTAAGRIDLLTAIEHEIGHKLGLDDSYAEKDRDSIMYGYLTVGERRVPAKGEAAKAQAGSLAGTHFLKVAEGSKKAEVRGQKSEVRKAEGSKQKAVSRKNHAATTRALAPVSGETLNYTIGALPAGKSVRITFKVTIDVGFGGTQVSNQGTVSGTLNVTPFTISTDDPDTGAPNDATVTQVVGLTTANDDAYNAFKNTPLNIAAPGVRANDSNVTAVTGVGGCGDVTDPFTGCATTGGGTVTMNGDGSFSYSPLTGFTGPDTFTYSVTGGTGTDTATVTITVADTSAIYINEVLFHPDGTGTNEYIELRGPISGLIPAGTYLVVVDGDAGTTAGDVTTIINLSGLSFGTNGFLVLLQNGNTYTTAAGATVITSTTTGFGGLAGAPWQADGGATSLENSGATFMLIQTGAAPTLTDDIDANDDGTPDGSVYPGWSVRDSVGHLTGANASDRAYGAINYITGGSGTGSGTVVTPSFISVYVGRICDSTGSTAADWVASDGLGGSAPNWTLGSNTSPASFAGNPLDHIGTTNFVNNAPVNTVPGAQITGEDTAFVFTGATQISIADSDAGSNSVEVTLTATNGTMTLSGTGGLTFTPPGAGNDGTADTTMVFTGTVTDINTALNNLTFTPTSNYSGPASVQIQTNDQGNTGGAACSTAQSDNDTVNITVSATNDAPVLDNTGNMALNSIPQDVPAASNPGTLVSDIILSAGGDRITDADAGALEGIAVNAVNNTNGTWEFTTNGGGIWTAFGSPTDGIARLLNSDANTRVRFLPTLGFSGTVNPGITFRAWDQTSGTNGATGNASINGGATAFSTATETASITVSSTVAVQDATVAEPTSGTTNMVFTVTLNAPAAPGGASVNFTTADEPAGPGKAVAGVCGSGGDYVLTSGTINFAAGEQVKTISVPVCSDGTAEPDETFLVNLSVPVNLTIGDPTATGTITAANTAGAILISELRTSGPAGATDEFVEIYNNSNSSHTVAASDASAGYGVYIMGADCNATPILVGTIPNGTVIPARGHYLLVGSTYSLGAYAAGNLTLTFDIGSDANVAIFSTANVAAISSVLRLDAVGFGTNTGGNCDLLREGSNLPAVSGSVTEHSFFRKLCDFTTACTTPGLPKDTNNNATDFLFADTQGTLIPGVPRLLGAPGPENLASPLKRDAVMPVVVLDASVAPSSPPNRTRDLTSNPGNNSTFGTLSVRRRIVNGTGANVNRLRFRIVEMTTFQPPSAGVADLRALTSTLVVVSGVNDPATCFASTGLATTPCTVNVQGTTLEQPPTQTIGGGLNATLAAGTVTLGTPLAPGASVNVQFLLGVQQTGSFRFLIIVEALP